MTGVDGSTESNYRGHVTQKAVVFNAGEVLLVRSASDNPWSIPGGRVQDGEAAEEALERELREETGLPVEVGWPIQTMTEVWYTTDGESMYTVVYACETGQRGVELNHEHEEFRWVSVDTAKQLLPLHSLVAAVDRAAQLRP